MKSHSAVIIRNFLGIGNVFPHCLVQAKSHKLQRYMYNVTSYVLLVGKDYRQTSADNNDITTIK